MKREQYTGKLDKLTELAFRGRAEDVDQIMLHLNADSSLVMTRFVDFALSLVEDQEGVERIRHYLFKGSLIQRNYASLYFNRIGDWPCVKEAFQQGLIDEIQAYAR